MFLNLHITADVLAVGSCYNNNVKAEMLLVARNTWITISDYPFAMNVLRSFFFRQSFTFEMNSGVSVLSLELV